MSGVGALRGSSIGVLSPTGSGFSGERVGVFLDLIASIRFSLRLVDMQASVRVRPLAADSVVGGAECYGL
ncbi:hypothetical protein PS3A_09460 [Pseudomonas sp. 3A(2025)]